MREQYQRYVPLLFSILMACLLLFSACSSTSTAPSSGPTTQNAPAIDSSLKNQGDMQLQTFQQWIALMQQYGGNITSFQQQYTADQQALANAKTDAAYKTALNTLNAHVESIKFPAMLTEARTLLQQLQKKADDWGKTHHYYDDYDKTTYSLGFEYTKDGVAGWAQDELNASETIAALQQTIEDLNMYLTNFDAMAKNTSDKTPYNQFHQTDLELLKHYDLMNKKVVVVSLEEEAMRVYQNGQLVKAFFVTTGRPIKPTPPGVWWVEGKQSPTTFKSTAPKGSPDWYPDTPINYAMQYHSGGYFLHDSWWRNDYGPGTNFPHEDSSGDSFSAQGSHGCVNISTENAKWLYGFVELFTPVLIY